MAGERRTAHGGSNTGSSPQLPGPRESGQVTGALGLGFWVKGFFKVDVHPFSKVALAFCPQLSERV